MILGHKIPHILAWLATIILQLILTQVATFAASMLVPDAENFFLAHPPVFALLLSIAFAIGVFLGGWLALKLRWLAFPPRLLWRSIGALLGAALPLIAALLIYRVLEPGNPFFLISIVVSIVGFYVPSAFSIKNVPGSST